MRRFYITDAIDYSNGAPHLGHAYEKVLTDCLARAHKQAGHEPFFLAGTDEHGPKVERTARKGGPEPQDYVDRHAGLVPEAQPGPAALPPFNAKLPDGFNFEKGRGLVGRRRRFFLLSGQQLVVAILPQTHQRGLDGLLLEIDLRARHQPTHDEPQHDRQHVPKHRQPHEEAERGRAVSQQ